MIKLVKVSFFIHSFLLQDAQEEHHVGSRGHRR